MISRRRLISNVFFKRGMQRSCKWIEKMGKIHPGIIFCIESSLNRGSTRVLRGHVLGRSEFDLVKTSLSVLVHPSRWISQRFSGRSAIRSWCNYRLFTFFRISFDHVPETSSGWALSVLYPLARLLQMRTEYLNGLDPTYACIHHSNEPECAPSYS